MEPGIQYSIYRSFPVILIRINPIPRSDNYFLKIHSNIALTPTTRPS